MLRAWILTIFFSISLFATFGYTEEGKPWKGSVTDADLAVVVNFIINNKGKDIDLAGKRHTITGKEKLDVVITVLECCDERAFIKDISALGGEVKSVKFPHFYTLISGLKILEIDKNGEVTEIKFTPEARGFWMNAIKHGLKK